MNEAAKAAVAGKTNPFTNGCAFAPWRDPSAKPYLRLIEIEKKFGDVTAVDRISLDIYAREFFALLGPSGCGKTTLLRMLAGFEAPTSGRIELDGVDIAKIPPYERPVNMMFQSYALFPHMSVERNIAFGLQQEGMPKAQIAERVEEMLGLTKLTKLAKRRPDQLSGGQRQRVALARALAKRPKLLLLDEPLGALDKKLREETQFELVNIQEKLGLTFVIVTHDQEEAMTVSTRLAVMDEGTIAQVGTPQEVYEAPRSRYVAEFIGDVNIFDGTLEGLTPEGARILCPDAPVPIIATRLPAGAPPSDAIGVAIRPEKLVIERLDAPNPPATNRLEGNVEDIAYLGDMSIYRVRLASGQIVKAARTNRARTTTEVITWEDQVRLSWDPSAVVILGE
ncbi:MAG: ABC transporter ATP-binding protein [Neomegalonema sp.]|nr:ABC transporter ATP-binding protein [Neomegalonema sp.]